MGSDFLISGLRSVELEVPDLARSAAFYMDVWGLVEAERADGHIYLRCEGEDAYAVRLNEASVPAILSYTLRAADGTDLAALRARAIAAGGVADGDIAPMLEAGGGTGFSLRDTVGRKLRVVQGDTRLDPFNSGQSRPDRLSHININTTDLERDIAFYELGFGFRVTDRSKMMGFVRTNSDHHTVVLAKAPVDTLNHIAFNHPTWEDVMKASGRMVDADYPMGWGPGRHGPGDNVFAYFVDPAGFVVEHTAEVLQVDDTYRVGGPEDWVWPAGRTDHWGVAPPKSGACKAAQLAIGFK
ncbi:putative ring-cleavage extradiol dioxygenase [Hoeflea sp. IMCC20628]|uniref:VOC family protein n=1 Tax=Hoeflea sp. IMCC20628 TaxID=1620421 RepID=UPI00063AF363|nr:VOC family protein [Hoeflea sp. IMCC20628]AKI01930.1 putative ring-cleavage extradiol dioxygenase [Hoeflea sp. IMCC20628]